MNDQDLEDFMDNREKRLNFAFMALDKKNANKRRKKRLKSMKGSQINGAFLFVFLLFFFIVCIFALSLR